MTPEEMQRMVLAHEKVLSADNGRFVRRDLYDRDLHHLAEDVEEIKESNKWLLRLVVSEFLALIVVLVVMSVNRLA